MARNGKVTAAQIAESLGLSKTTISLALTGKAERHRIPQRTVDRILQAAKQMDYQPNLVARQLAGKKSNAIGVLVNTEAVADVRLLQAMEILAAERGIRFIVGHAVKTQEQVRSYLNDFEARGVDGVISIFHNHPDYSAIVQAELARFETVVYFERPGGLADAGACFVEPDYDAIGRIAAQHLVERGCKRIGMVFSNLEFPYACRRRAAHESYLMEALGSVDPDLVWVLDREMGAHWTDAFTPEMAQQAVDALVAARGADGLVAVNDLYAARLIGALGKRGLRVPGDVAVIGCDNLELGTLVEPPLTTIWCDIDAQARAVIDMLFEQLAHGPLPAEKREVIIAPELIVRETT